MDLIAEYNKQLERQKHITGVAMKVFNKYIGIKYTFTNNTIRRNI